MYQMLQIYSVAGYHTVVDNTKIATHAFRGCKISYEYKSYGLLIIEWDKKDWFKFTAYNGS